MKGEKMKRVSWIESSATKSPCKDLHRKSLHGRAGMDVLEAYELAKKIEAADEWNLDDCTKLVNLMNMQTEWEKADGDCFEGVVQRAIDDAYTLYAWEASGAAMDLAGRV